MTYRTLNIAEGAMQEGQSQNSREISTQTTSEGDEISHELYCPIGHMIMVDPVMAPDEQRYDRANIERWLQTNRISPVTRQEFPLEMNLITDRAFRDKIDRYLSQEDIEKRRQSDRERARKQAEELRREREPLLILGISEEELKQISSIDKVRVLRTNLDLVKILLHETPVSWNDLMHTHSSILKKILPPYPFFRVSILLKSSISWAELIQTDMILLEKLLPHVVDLETLLEIGISWNELTQTNLNTLRIILHNTVSAKKILETGVSWVSLKYTNHDILEMILANDENIKILVSENISYEDIIKYSEKLKICFEKKFYSPRIIKFIKIYLIAFTKLKEEDNSVSKKFMSVMESPINQILDLLSEKSIIINTLGVMKFPTVYWGNLPSESKRFLFDHSEQVQNLFKKYKLSYQIAWHTGLLEGIFAHQPRIQQWFSEHPSYDIGRFYANLIDVHMKLRKEYPTITFADYPDQYLLCFQKEDYRSRFLFYFYRECSKDQLDFLSRQLKTPEERIMFENEIMLPLIKKDYHLNFRHYLASFDNVRLLTEKENASQAVSALITLADCIPERLGCSPNDLPEAYARFLSRQFLNHYIQYVVRTRVPTTETSISILFINYYLYNLIEQLQAKQYYLRTHAAAFQFLKTLEKIQSVFSGEWHCLLSSGNFKEGVSLYQFYVVLQAEAQHIEKIISKDITHRSVFRRDTGLQIFCVILNVLLLICVPISWPVYATRFILHCCNKDKYPNILFLPNHPIAREAQACQSQITELIERVEQDQRTLPCSSKNFSIYAHSKSKDSNTSLPLPEIRR